VPDSTSPWTISTTCFSAVSREGGLRSSLDLLAEFTLDVWLAARFTPRPDGFAPDGRTWERTIGNLLYRPGFTRRQGPGNHTLFGKLSASGVEHEIDGAADGWRGSVVVECKATDGGITKGDVALFHVKVMDFYQKRITTACKEKWWRVLCGTAATSSAARATAVNLGLLICDPGRLPLPVLVRAAGRPSADMYLPESLLQEIVWLGERALRPQQERWPYHVQVGEIGFRPDLWKGSEIKDLIWLEDELSGHILDLYERHRPGSLERLAANLFWQARKVA
jgi:hypothetical protein